MSNNTIILSKLKELKSRYESNLFVTDKSGVKTVELLNMVVDLDPTQPIIDLGFKKTNESYVQKELSWYLNQDLNVYPQMSDITIWIKVCDKDGFINSNYGWCIFSKENYSQYDYAVNELKNNQSSRRACMMYNRPSMTEDYNKNGRSDYICTIYTQLFIRDNKLIYNVKQRSCDAIYGFFNDFAWHCYVYDKVFKDLLLTYPSLEIGHINYSIDSFHIYEKHFKFFDNF